MTNIGELSIGVKLDQNSLNSATNQAKKSLQEIGDKAENALNVDGSGLKSFNNELKNTQNQVKNIGSTGGGGIQKLIGGFATLYAGIQSLSFLWKSYNSALAENSQYERLYKLLNNVTGATREQVKVLNEQAQAIEKVGVVTASSVTQVQSQLATFDLNIDTIERLTPAIIDYVVAEKGARATTEDFQSATNGLAQALNGNFQSLTAVGFVLDEATKKTISNGTEMERSQAIVDVLNSTYRGFNEAVAQTDEGKVINLQNRFAMLSTELGTRLIPVFSYLMDVASQALDVFKSNEERVDAYTKKIKDNENAQAFLKNQLDQGKISQEEYGNQMDQLTAKHDELSKKAGAVGTDIISTWHDVITAVQKFFADYGTIIISTVKNTGTIIVDTVKFIYGIFKDFFAGLGILWGDAGKDVNMYAFLFLKLVQAIGVGIGVIMMSLKTLMSKTAIQLTFWVELFKFAFIAIIKGFDILKIAFFGTIKSISDVANLGTELIGQAFVTLAEAIVGVFSGIAVNVGVAVIKAGNLAIRGINKIIDGINKIPGVNINRLVETGDAGFQSFNLGLKKNLGVAGNIIGDFANSVKGNYAGIGANLESIGTSFKDGVRNVTAVAEQEFTSIGQGWSDLGGNIILQNEKIAEGSKKSTGETKKNVDAMSKSFDKATSSANEMGDSTDKAGKKSKEASDTAKDSIDKIKKLYADWEKKVEDVNKASEKLRDDTKKYNQDIEDSLRSLTKELAGVSAEYEKFVSQTKVESGADIADRGVEVNNEILAINKEIATLQIKATKGVEEYSEKLQDLNTLQQKRLDLLKEQEFINANSTEAQRAEATRVAGLSQAEKIKEEADKKIAEETKTFEAEKKRIESLTKINQIFLDTKALSQKEYDELIKSDKFNAMTQEEQELILKLARDKLALTTQRDQLIQMQQDVFDATVDLSNRAREIQQANLNTLKADYAVLINQIQNAIQKQKELNSLKSKNGFASGGFTGAGGVNEVKGVVHAGERVAPKWMVNNMKPLFDSLENARGKGFAQGGYTSNTNKTQNNNITVNNEMDLRGFMDFAKWKL